MDAAAVWKDFFRNWPVDLPQRGIVVTRFDEQIPFQGFLVSDAFVILERTTPDSLGSRKVLFPFENIEALKIVDPTRDKVFTAAGFAAVGNAKKAKG